MGCLIDARIVDPIIGQHVAHLRYLNRRPSSIAKRASALDLLLRRAGQPLLTLDGETLMAFVDRAELGPDARAATVSHLRGFYRWACEEGLLDIDPTVRLKRPKRERRLPRPMADDVAAYALHRSPEPLRAWFWLAAYAGLRCCEIAQVRGSDFLLDQVPAILIVRESKGGDTTVVPICAPLRPVALELSLIDGWCFPNGAGDPARIDRDGHITANQVQRRANRWLHESGFPDTIHRARHWFGTQAFRATGRDLRATQELMRHRSPVSTAIYTFVDMGESARALDNLPELDRPPEAA